MIIAIVSVNVSVEHARVEKDFRGRVGDKCWLTAVRSDQPEPVVAPVVWAEPRQQNRGERQ